MSWKFFPPPGKFQLHFLRLRACRPKALWNEETGDKAFETTVHGFRAVKARSSASRTSLGNSGSGAGYSRNELRLTNSRRRRFPCEKIFR